MRYYISDLHFFHESLNTQMDCRGFKDSAQMNAYMIKQWNSRVRPKDEVVILGDFSVGKAKETNEVLSQLKCVIVLFCSNWYVMKCCGIQFYCGSCWKKNASNCAVSHLRQELFYHLEQISRLE